MQILQLLQEQPRTAAEVAEVLHRKPPAISHHIKVLYQHGWIQMVGFAAAPGGRTTARIWGVLPGPVWADVVAQLNSLPSQLHSA